MTKRESVISYFQTDKEARDYAQYMMDTRTHLSLKQIAEDMVETITQVTPDFRTAEGYKLSVSSVTQALKEIQK